MSGAVAVFGAHLGLKAIAQFVAEGKHLTGTGFFDLLPFRSRLITPPAAWIIGEWFSVLLLALPFACSVPVFLWRRERRWRTTLAILPPLIVTLALAKAALEPCHKLGSHEKPCHSRRSEEFAFPAEKKQAT